MLYSIYSCNKLSTVAAASLSINYRVKYNLKGSYHQNGRVLFHRNALKQVLFWFDVETCPQVLVKLWRGSYLTRSSSATKKRLNAYWLRQLVSLVDGLWRKSFDVNSFLSFRLLPFNALMIWNEPTKWEYIFILLYYWATNGFWGWNWDLEFIMG